MADKNDTKKIKRLSKGQRTHVRRMKQEARKEAIPVNPKVKKVVEISVSG